MERGYRETTLAQIIARAGGSRETIYKTMGGKSGILQAVVATAGQKVADSILAPAWMNLPPRDALTRLGETLAAIWFGAEARGVHRIVLSEGLDSPEIVRAWYEGGTAVTVEALSRYLEAQTAAGHLRPHDSGLVARQFVFLLAGELGFPFVAGIENAAPSDVHVRRCVDLILSAHEA